MTTAQQASVAGENYVVEPNEGLAHFRERRRFLNKLFAILVPKNATKEEVAYYREEHMQWARWYMPELVKEYLGER